MAALPTGGGVVFPDDGKAFEKRSSTDRAKEVLAASLEGAGAKEAATKVRKVKDWRFGYQPHVQAVIQAMSDPSNTVEAARAGLCAVHKSFSFHREGEGEMPTADAMKPGRFSGTFNTAVVKGTGSSAKLEASVPFRKSTYTGSALSSLVKKFAQGGEAEPTLATSIEEVASSPSAIAPPTDGVFVLIGATSEMGPCETLLKGGATVIALARKAGRGGAKRWEELAEAARASPAGTLIAPAGSATTTADAANFAPSDFGADALVHTPEIVNWLFDLFTQHPLCKGKRPLIYSGIYLDGQKFVRASVAMELIIHELSERLFKANALTPSLLYIDTPSHVHLLPNEVAKKPVRGGEPLWLKIFGGIGLIKGYKKKEATGAKGYSVCDFTSTQQGPNYAVAKIIQRWRAVFARHSTGSLFDPKSDRPKNLVSITTGPPAKTESVMHAKTMALVMKNVHQCPPNAAHEPETVRALMTLVMLRDLKSNKALGNPSVDKAAGGKNNQHPMDFLVENAWHGGSWRCAYSMDSVGPFIVVFALYGKVILLALMGLGGLALYGGARYLNLL